jgi:hypothetical protein
MRTKAWVRAKWSRVVLGVVAGGWVGLAVYEGTRLTGPTLFLACGAVAGLISALVVYGANQTIRLTDVRISVPHFSEMHFAITKDSQLVAWKLFVETVTRISTQRLDPRGGLVREAMSSLYTLFNITRDVLKESQPSRLTGDDPTVEHLAIAMLNMELRPFLSHWHPHLRAWERENPGADEVDWPGNAECRAEMAAMQQRLAAYVLGFGKLARVPNPQQILTGTLNATSSAKTADVPRQANR